MYLLEADFSSFSRHWHCSYHPFFGSGRCREICHYSESPGRLVVSRISTDAVARVLHRNHSIQQASVHASHISQATPRPPVHHCRQLPLDMGSRRLDLRIVSVFACRFHSLKTVIKWRSNDWLIGEKSRKNNSRQNTVYNKSNCKIIGGVDDITWPWKVKDMTPIANTLTA